MAVRGHSSLTCPDRFDPRFRDWVELDLRGRWGDTMALRIDVDWYRVLRCAYDIQWLDVADLRLE